MAETKLAEQQPQEPVSKALITVTRKGVELTSLDEIWRFAGMVEKSGLSPKGMSREGIVVAITMGLELGLSPMAAVQNIAPINGKPAAYGDVPLAICRGTGQLDEFTEWFESGPDDKPVRLTRNPTKYTDDVRAVCRVRRRGYDPIEIAFSVADAKRAKLWEKTGPWTEYPFRMLKFRARAFALRDQFGDALKGINIAEEVLDDPKMVAGRVVEEARIPATPLFAQPPATAAAPAEFTLDATPEPTARERLVAEVEPLARSKVDKYLLDAFLPSLDTMTEADAAEILTKHLDIIKEECK